MWPFGTHAATTSSRYACTEPDPTSNWFLAHSAVCGEKWAQIQQVDIVAERG